MDDTQVCPFEYQRQCGQTAFQCGFVRFGQNVPRGVAFGVLVVTLGEKPARTVFEVVHEGVEFVVAQHGKGVAGTVRVEKPIKHGGTVGAAVAQVADENGFSALRMAAVAAVAEMVQQGKGPLRDSPETDGSLGKERMVR